jgi:hypothetical protein
MGEVLRTEAQWAEWDDPDTMVWYLRSAHNATRTRVGRRKLRLFCCACARQVWELIPEAEGRAAVEVCERYADGQATAAELEAARERGIRALTRWPQPDRTEEDGVHAGRAAHYAVHPKQTEDVLKQCVSNTCLARFYARNPGHRGPIPVVGNAYGDAKRGLAGLVRDIFGNPFRPTAADPSWRTSDVLALTRGIYAERAFDRLPILADALQDAGCDDAALLAHCRGPGPHVRGCWVVDLLLGEG